MDERVHDHAETLVDWSARVEEGDDVVLSVGPAAHDLAVAVAELLGDRGANLLTTYGSKELGRAYVRGTNGEFGAHDHERAMYEAADVVLSLGGGRNTNALADVPGERHQAYRNARTEAREARYDTRWVSTDHPTRSLAQQAGMAYEEYQEFAYDAILRDWEALAAEMAEVKTVLDEGSEVHLRSAETDLTMSIEGRTAVNSAASVAYDSHNLPSGEVFTAPEATEGEVLFDIPMTIDGEGVEGVRLEFEDGEVTEYEADRGEDVITDLLETDEGACRLGELGIGMNRGIDRYTDNVLFDEKMAETVHLALGRAYDACLPEGESGNESAIHTDMLIDTSEDSILKVDGEVLQRDGEFLL